MNYSTKTNFQVKVTVWNRDIKGLYAYDSLQSQLKISTFNIANKCKVYRDNTHGQNYFKSGDCKLSQHYTFVCQLDYEDSQSNPSFWLRIKEPNSASTAKNTPYLVLKKNDAEPLGGYPLTIGDTVKFGTIQYTVIEVKTKVSFQSLFDKNIPNKKHLGQVYQVLKSKKQEIQEQSQNSQPKRKQKKIKKQKQAKQKSKKTKRQSKPKKFEAIELEIDENQNLNQNPANLEPLKSDQNSKSKIQQIIQKQQVESCKICMTTQQSDDNPLISPCICKGSCALIHVGCLKEWVNSRTKKQIKNGVTSYHLNKASCQICTHPYPKLFKSGIQMIPLVDFQLPNTSYMILQSSNTEGQFKDARDFIVIEGKSNKIINIGRSQQHQIKLKDVSVSRKHAQIYYFQNKFYIRDAKSKFGTLLQLQKDMKFNNETVTVQIGRCRYDFTPLTGQNTSNESQSWEQFD